MTREQQNTSTKATPLIPEAVWQRAELDQRRRERERLTLNRTVRPRLSPPSFPPTHVYRTSGGEWARAIGFHFPLETGWRL